MTVSSSNGVYSVNSSYETSSERQPGSPSSSYEDFMSTNVECPTCRGLGKINKGSEELVALIPISDSRLKPRKTLLYVFLAVLVCVIAAGLLLFFLISRSVSLSCSKTLYRPTNITLIGNTNVSEQLNLIYQVPVNVTNNNYLPITVTNIQLSPLLYGAQLIGSSSNDTELSIPMRSTKYHYITVNQTLKGDTARDIKDLINACQTEHPILWTLPLNFQITANITYLSHTESSSITLYNRRVCCHSARPDSDLPPSLENCEDPN